MICPCQHLLRGTASNVAFDNHPKIVQSRPGYSANRIMAKEFCNKWKFWINGYLPLCLLTTSIMERSWQPRPNRWSYGISYGTWTNENCELFPISRPAWTKCSLDKPLLLAPALPLALKMACYTFWRAQFSAYCQVELSIWTAFWCSIQIMHPFYRSATNERATVWFHVDSAFTKFVKIYST